MAPAPIATTWFQAMPARRRGGARAGAVAGFWFRGAERAIETQITPDDRLMRDVSDAASK